MPTYAAITFHTENEYALFEIDDLSGSSFLAKASLLRLLFINTGKKNLKEVQLKRSGNILAWRYYVDYKDKSSYSDIVVIQKGLDTIVEFPDDKTALLWFKLNY
jgi:hypothetical protein